MARGGRRSYYPVGGPGVEGKSRRGHGSCRHPEYRRSLHPPSSTNRGKYDLDPAAFPVASDISNRTLSLPLGTNVTHADQDDVVEALRMHLVTRIGVGA